MKLSRIAIAVTTALAPAVLLASPAFADTNQVAASTANPPAPTAPDREAAEDSAEDQAEQDRKTILAIIADPMASEYMKEAGHKAIADGPAAMRTFIETDQHSIRLDDYRIAIMRLLHSAGPSLKEGVEDFLKTDGRTLADLRHFYEVTQHELRDIDNRVEIARLANTAGAALKEAAKKALLGTPADRIAFLEQGRHIAQAEDDRVELARIDEGWDGPILSEAISKLLNGSPTPAELRHFLEVTQHELRDQDNRVEIARIIDEGGPELVKAGRAALAGTPPTVPPSCSPVSTRPGRRTRSPSRRRTRTRTTTRTTARRTRTAPGPGATARRTREQALATRPWPRRASAALSWPPPARATPP